MSTISDALKKSKEVFFLVECDFDGLIKRYATKNISVPNSDGDAIFFEGKILNDFQIATKFDISGPRYSISNITIEIANDDRLQDSEPTRVLDGGLCKIYVWCTGLDWTNIDTEGVVFKGVFEKNSHDKYTYSFNIVGQMKTKFKELTGLTISSSTWAGHRITGGGGSVAGKAQPFVFGNWTKGVPLLCVSTTDFKYLAGAMVSGSSDGDYTAATKNIYDKDGAVISSTDYTFYPRSNDSQGNTNAYFDIVSDQVSLEPLSCSIRGQLDGSGVYTGTANTLMEHPGDIIYFLMDQYSNLISDDIDVESLKTIKSVLPGLKYSSIINQSINGFDIINRFLTQIQCALMTRVGGKVGVMVFNVNVINTSPDIDGNNDIVGVPQFGKTREDLICNSLFVKYAFNPTTKQYEKELTKDRTNNTDCENSFFQYGERPTVLLPLPDIQNEGNAIMAASRFIDIRAFRHDTVVFDVPYWIGWNVQEGDAGQLTLEDGPSSDGNGWIDEKCILLEKTFKSNTIGQKWWKIAI